MVQKGTFYYYLAAISLPAFVTAVTDQMSVLGAMADVLVPVGAFWFLLSLSRKLGRSIWLMFPFAFFAAFNMVLIWLYGYGVIAVDMWLNLVTTNPGEATELLSQLGLSLVFVGVVYLPPLIMGVRMWYKKVKLETKFLQVNRRVAGVVFVIGIFLGAGAMATTNFSPLRQIYPINVIQNLCIAINRTARVEVWKETAANFKYNAQATHPDSVREVYIIVIGETSRSENWQLSGYHKPTNPLLSQEPCLVYFPNAWSESNTTHKSVPMMLTPLEARTFDEIYKTKGIAQAAKEAGFHTAFFSNQRPNRSFIEFFGNEADTVVYLKGKKPLGSNPPDRELIRLAKAELAKGRRKEFIILHTYGSHFDYRQRYAPEDRVFLPDQFPRADQKYRPALLNAYDNTIVATDRLLSQAIGLVKNEVGAVIFASDHGEDIFDDKHKLFLHASPRPTIHQVKVPFLVYTSERYDSLYPQIHPLMEMNKSKGVSSSRSYFHTAMDLAGMKTPYYNGQSSVANENYTIPSQVYLDDHNECVPIEEIVIR